MWLVTTVYATKEAWINVWGDKDNVVSIGFSAGVEGVAKLALSVVFAESSSGSNWRTLPAVVCPMLQLECSSWLILILQGAIPEDVVVFFHGVQMRYWPVVVSPFEWMDQVPTVLTQPGGASRGSWGWRDGSSGSRKRECPLSSTDRDCRFLTGNTNSKMFAHPSSLLST